MRITAPKHVALSSSQHAIQAMSRKWTRTFSTMFTCDLVCPAATTRRLADCARADQHLLPGRWSQMEGRGRRIWPGKPSRLYCVPPQPCHSRYRTSYVGFIAPPREHRGLCRVLLGAVSPACNAFRSRYVQTSAGSCVLLFKTTRKAKGAGAAHYVIFYSTLAHRLSGLWLQLQISCTGVQGSVGWRDSCGGEAFAQQPGCPAEAALPT